MGILKAFSSSSFKTDDMGRTCFFPYGIFGKGILINNDSKKNKIERFLRSYYAIGICTVLVSQLFSSIASILVFILLCVIYRIVISDMTRGLPVCTTTNLTIHDTTNTQAAEYSFLFLWLLFIVSLIAVILGIYIVFKRTDQLLIGLSGILFFGLASFVFGYLIYIKKKGSHN